MARLYLMIRLADELDSTHSQSIRVTKSAPSYEKTQFLDVRYIGRRETWGECA
jgi:hypothetical protein